MRTLRIGLARVGQETNSFSPLLSEIDDFRRTHFVAGEALGALLTPTGIEAEGFLRDAELSGAWQTLADDDGVEPIPVFSAWTVPGGKLRPECLEELVDTLIHHVRHAGPLDGLVLSLHGAMGALGLVDPEAWLLERLREVVGDLPIVATIDLHAHLSPAKMAQTPYWIGYHTNPHRDHRAVGRRAARFLVDLLRRRTRPKVAWRTLPMVLGGGTTLDFGRTMNPLFRKLWRWRRRGKVLDASLLMCHLWHEHPELGWVVHVMTDGDQDLAEKLADELADDAWAVRHAMPPALPDAAEAIDRARSARLRRTLGTVCMSDASDMVGAGAPGESTLLLRALLEDARDLSVLAPIRDAPTVERLWSMPIGRRVDIDVGGRFDPVTHPPLPVHGRIRAHRSVPGLGRCVLLDCAHLQLVITDGPPLAMKPSFYGDLGLSPWRADVCVVKSLFPFRLYFAAHNRMSIYARTLGATDFDAPLRGTFARPVHPITALDDWRDADRARRGLAPHR